MEPLCIDLPLPPSVNRNARVAYLGNSAARVKAWHSCCDLALREQGLCGDRLHARAIPGAWIIEITWAVEWWGRFDLDNRVKYLLDYLRSRELVQDDILCSHMQVSWGYAPRGCRVHLEKLETPMSDLPKAVQTKLRALRRAQSRR